MNFRARHQNIFDSIDNGEIDEAILKQLMYEAISRGQLSVISFLIPFVDDNARRYALRWAITMGHYDIVRDLLKYITSDDQMLSSAVLHNRVDIVRLLLPGFCDPVILAMASPEVQALFEPPPLKS